MSTTRSSSTSRTRSPTRVIVVGAGWTGLAAAKTYLQINPTIQLTIIDSCPSIGGVWSSTNIYPGLIADSCAAVFDYSDMPMHEELGIDKWADLPAEKICEYLERYAEKCGLSERCKLNTKVVKAEKRTEGGWKVEIETKKDFEEYTVREVLECDKLIVATGVTSSPNMPEDLDWKEFEGPVMHSKEVGEKHKQLTADKVKRVTVVGGSKSAVDVVNMCALAGKEVDWVIREEGYGPLIMAPPRTHGIHAGAIKNIRATTLALPNIHITDGMFYNFLLSGKSKMGSKLVKYALEKGSKSAIKSVYGKNENTMKIAPDMKNLLWANCEASILHDPKFMDTISEDKVIHVHRASVTSFSKTTITLSTGVTLPSDAVVFATGWTRTQPTIFNTSELPVLGLPFALSDQLSETAKHWESLSLTSTQGLKSLFPLLANPPPEVVEYDKAHIRPPIHTPFRLFRNIAPPQPSADGQRDLIFLGTILNTAIPIYAEIASLWGIAYMESLPFSDTTTAKLSSLTDMEKDISRLNAWQKLRFRDEGARYLDGSVEIQNFIDELMGDLGLRWDRKRVGKGRLRGWVKEWVEPYKSSDYRGVVEEYLGRWGLREESKGKGKGKERERV